MDDSSHDSRKTVMPMTPDACVTLSMCDGVRQVHSELLCGCYGSR